MSDEMKFPEQKLPIEQLLDSHAKWTAIHFYDWAINHTTQFYVQDMPDTTEDLFELYLKDVRNRR